MQRHGILIRKTAMLWSPLGCAPQTMFSDVKWIAELHMLVDILGGGDLIGGLDSKL